MEDRTAAAKGAGLDRGETARVARDKRRRAKKTAKAARGLSATASAAATRARGEDAGCPPRASPVRSC